MPYPDDERLRIGTIDLLGSVWGGLPRAIERARRWGADWFEHSQPFVEVDHNAVVAHVGVIDIPVVLNGNERSIAGVHAVCTRADLRGHGYLRRVMARALAWIDERYETAVLWANDPAIYRRFGFEVSAEATFHGPIVAAPVTSAIRTLSVDDANDLDFLKARLRGRVAVSARCGAREPGWLALINLALESTPSSTLAFLPELDAIVVHKRSGDALHILDIVAPQMPTLADVSARVANGASSVEISFSPESLDAPQLTPVPLAAEFMVRGPLLADARPFALSPLAHC